MCIRDRLNGAEVTKLPPEKRAVNTVFQNYALFPHMNVQKNIAYPMKLRRVKKEDALKIGVGMMNRGEVALIAVSYTHLDVYKRQYRR